MRTSWACGLLLLFTLAPAVARADASITSGEPTPSANCSFEDGPHWRRRHSVQNDARLKNVAPFGNLQHFTDRHLLFTRDGDGGGSALVTAEPPRPSPSPGGAMKGDDFHVIWEWPHPLTALAVNETGRLVGELRLATLKAGTAELSFYEPISYQQRWTLHGIYRAGEDSAATVVDGDQLIVATFHRIATGARLFSVDLKTGTPRWIADVEQVNASHSEYFNDVSLERRGKTVVMRGFEASGCYVQTFELATGRRLSSHMKRAW